MPTGILTTELASPDATSRGATHPSTVEPFHSDVDSGHPVSHDRSDCPYGREITSNGKDTPGTDGCHPYDRCARRRTSTT